MQIGIIGAGKVGTTLGKYVALHGGNVSGYYSRTGQSAQEAAQFTGTKYFQSLGTLAEASDTLFITTTDGEIPKVWDCIAAKDVQGKVICHFSGSLSSDVFSNWEETGAFACSVHPIYAFSDKFTAYLNLKDAVFSVEGSREALDRMQGLFCLLPNPIVEIPTGQKAKYHAATSIASNFVVGMVSMAVGLLEEAGIPGQAAYGMLKPLVENNVASIFAEPAAAAEGKAAGGRQKAYQGCQQALTGPIERGDLQTVQKHLQSFCDPKWERAYQAVGMLVAELAEQKHPGRDYGDIKKLLEYGRT
ncbi:MAG: DUF2520 domain-containing protein [Lachnospiraceae bacterium]|jgi:predicted short-subunit dehydrogenase-like oxidoreductase (DUF2520 family)|nr:DUF2520 domain-containing protein [Lachnospiraceae bacterium]